MKSRLIKKLLLSSATAAMTFTAPLTAAAEWKLDTNGWRNETGDSTSKGWNQIDGVWYYFDQNGYMQTGWIKYGENWYFTSSTGAMQTGVIEVDGEVYYLGDNGVMQTGDVTINNRTYHFDSSGKNTDASRPPVGKQFNGTNEVPKNKASDPESVEVQAATRQTPPLRSKTESILKR